MQTQACKEPGKVDTCPSLRLVAALAVVIRRLRHGILAGALQLINIERPFPPDAPALALAGLHLRVRLQIAVDKTAKFRDIAAVAGPVGCWCVHRCSCSCHSILDRSRTESAAFFWPPPMKLS